MKSNHRQASDVEPPRRIGRLRRDARAELLDGLARTGERERAGIVVDEHHRPERGVQALPDGPGVDERTPLVETSPEANVVRVARISAEIAVMEKSVLARLVAVRILRTRRDRDRQVEGSRLPDPPRADPRDALAVDLETIAKWLPREDIAVLAAELLEEVERVLTHQPIAIDAVHDRQSRRANLSRLAGGWCSPKARRRVTPL